MRGRQNKNYEKLKRKAQEKTQQILQNETVQKAVETPFSFLPVEEPVVSADIKTESLQSEVVIEVANVEKEKKDNVKITMLGASGSGKTVFLSGLHQTLIAAPENGFFLSIDEDADNKFHSLEEISLIQEDDDEGFKVIGFPNGTTATKTYDFTLKSSGRSFFTFEFWDYRGKLVSEVRPGHGMEIDRLELEGFKEHLKQSDVLLIFADATKISLYESVALRKVKSHASLMDTVFTTVLDMVERDYHVILVLTKIDDEDVKPEDKKENYQALCRKAMEVFESIREGSKTFAMIPVSAVGENKTIKVTEVDKNGKQIRKTRLREDVIPEPININTVIMHACIRVLKNRVEAIQREIKFLWQDAEEVEESFARLRGRNLENAREEYKKIVFGEIPKKEAEQAQIEDDINVIREVYGLKLDANTYYKRE